MFEAISNFIDSIKQLWTYLGTAEGEYSAERAWNQYLREFR